MRNVKNREAHNMNRITKEMIGAIDAVQNWQSGNTQVCVEDVGIVVYLNGDRIATVDGFNVLVDVQTLRQSPTRIAVSRLRALGVDVEIIDKMIKLNGKYI